MIHLPEKARAFVYRQLRAFVPPVCTVCRAKGASRSEKMRLSGEASERQRRIPKGYCLADVMVRLPKSLRPYVSLVCEYGAIESPSDEIKDCRQEVDERSRRTPVRRLLLETEGGMCTRLQALISGICWAEDLSCSLVVSWPYRPYTFCRFEDLFEIGSLPSFVTVTSCPLKSAPRLGTDYNVQNCGEDGALDPTVMDRLVGSAVERKMSSLCVTSWAHFHQSDPERWIRHLRALRPARDIAERVDTRLGAQTHPRIGFHVRSFESEMHQIPPEMRHFFRHSPLSAFLECMKRQDPGALFVVATNEDDIQSWLEREMPGRCLFPARVRDPKNKMGSREGMKEGLVDFLCLARCCRILGSSSSTFTRLAAAYGGAELEVVRDA